MKRLLSMMIIITVLLMPFTAIGESQDNLVENGTFDTDMDGWNTQTSQNFSITSNAGVCDVNTTHTDWMLDFDNTMMNATLYNMTLKNGDPSESFLNNYTELDGYQYQVLNNTFDNYSLNGWEYLEQQPSVSPFLRTNFSSAYNLSANLSLGAESIKLHNITDFDDNLTTERSSIGYENASTDFVYKTGHYECNYTNSRYAVRCWNISERRVISGINSNEFGMNVSIISNESGLQQNNAWILIGYGNRDELESSPQNPLNHMTVYIRRYNSTHMRSHMLLRNATGSAYNVGYSYWNYSNFTNGINVSIYSSSQSEVGYSIKDISTDHILASTKGGGRINFIINCIHTRSYHTGTESISANITHMKSWLAPNNLPTSASSTFNKTINIANESVRLDIETNRLHYHNAFNGLVKSAIGINSSHGSSELSNISTSSTSSWLSTDDTIRNVTGNFTLSSWNYFSLSEGQTSFPAKAVYYDNLTITATEYDWNGTYESQIFDRSYYADWQTIELYFNDTDGTYSPSYPFQTFFNISVYTRVGDHAVVDGTWSSWQQTENQQYSYIGYLFWQGNIASKNGEFFQYKIDIDLWKRGLEPPRFLFSQFSSIPINTSMEWGSFDQNITKPYTNYTTLKYDYKIQELNNTINGTIQVFINGSLINQHNYTFFETGWNNVEIDLDSIYNVSGTYNLNFTIITNFNSTNGSSTVWFDNVEMLITKQAPTITSFEIHNETDIRFSGNFTDLSRGSDYQYLGADGIESVNITVGDVVLEIDDYTYLGDGNFSFNYTWENTPFEIGGNITYDATLTVLDITDLQDQEVQEVLMPSATGFMVAILSAGLVVIFVVLIIGRHLGTEWDTIKPKHEGIMPTTLTGKGR